MYFMVIHQVMRVFIISVRYGFISDLRHDLYRDSLKNLDFISKDLMIENWIKLHPTKGIVEEIRSSLFRNRVEEQIFSLSFTQQLDQTTMARYSREDYYMANSMFSKEENIEHLAGNLNYFKEQRRDEIKEYMKRYELRNLMDVMNSHDRTKGKFTTKKNTMACEFENDIFYFRFPDTISDVKNLNE